MDLAVLIVGIVIGGGFGYFIWGPGKKQMAKKKDRQGVAPPKRPAQHRTPIWDKDDEDDE